VIQIEHMRSSGMLSWCKATGGDAVDVIVIKKYLWLRLMLAEAPLPEIPRRGVDTYEKINI